MAKINILKKPSANGSTLTGYNNTRPVHNPIIFSFETDSISYPTSVAWEGTLFIDITLDLLDGSKILFDGVEILVSDKPNSSQIPSINNAYPLYYPSDVINVYANKYLYIINRIISILNSNPTLKWKYSFILQRNINNLNPANFTIYIKSIVEGTKYIPSTFSFSQIPALPLQSIGMYVSINAVDGNLGMVNEKAGVFLDVYVDVEKDAIYNDYLVMPPYYKTPSTQRLQKFSNAENIIEFDISNILKNYTKTSIFNINISSAFQSAKEMVVNYHLRYGYFYEFKNNIIEEFISDIGLYGDILGEAYPQYWAIEGSLPLQNDQVRIDALFSPYYKLVPNSSQNKNLTNIPSTKFITPYQNEFLYHIFTRNTNETILIQRKVEWFFEDGTTSSEILNQTLSTSKFAEIFKFKSSVTAERNAIEYLTEKKVKHYDIYLVTNLDTNTPINSKQRYSYHFDNRCQNIEGEVYFLNALGGFDTIQINGMLLFNLDSKRIEYSKNNTLTYSYTNYILQGFDRSKISMSEVLNIDTNYTVQCATGYLPSDHYEWAKEMINSKEIYLKTNITIDGWDSTQMRRTSLVSFEYNKDINTDMYSFVFTLKFSVQLNSRI